jgi:hypothetical protein
MISSLYGRVSSLARESLPSAAPGPSIIALPWLDFTGPLAFDDQSSIIKL